MTRHIDINLSAQTLEQLKNANFALYALKAVKYGFKGVVLKAQAKALAYGGGAPLVWLKRENYLQLTTLAWEAAVQGYISTSPIVEQQPVAVEARTDVDLGQTVYVSAPGGLSIGSGSAGVVSLINQGTTAWTCGLAQAVGGASPAAPTCAFPLYGGGMDVLTPLDSVLLMFASNLLAAGAVVTTAYSSAVLVDAAAADRAVTFDINLGWGPAGPAWLTPVAPDANIGNLLVRT
jgi:hypothetical protein